VGVPNDARTDKAIWFMSYVWDISIGITRTQITSSVFHGWFHDMSPVSLNQGYVIRKMPFVRHEHIAGVSGPPFGLGVLEA
jgi:hypothetical protein